MAADKDIVHEPPAPKAAVKRRLVIPIRNRKEAFFELSPWFLSERLRVDQISNEDYATLHRDDEMFVSIVSIKQQCIVADLEPNQDAALATDEIASKVQFSFASFSSIPLILSHAVVISTAGTSEGVVEKKLQLPVLGDYSKLLAAPFAFHAGIEPQQVIDLLKVLNTAIEKHPSFRITLSRFNSSKLRSADHDKVIDIAICLESLHSSTTEISFKFALFTSFIARQQPAEREEVFGLLQVLYGARSSIVHGDSDGKSSKKKLEDTLKSLNTLFEVARAAISYYALFLYSKDAKEWQKHIEKLVFGTEPRIT